MLIVCPSCASSYSLTPEQLGRGRRLRCAACRHEWHALPPQDDAVDGPAASDSPGAFDKDPFEAFPSDVSSAVGAEAEPQSVGGSRGKASSKPRIPFKARLQGLARVPRISPVHAAVAALVLLVGAGIVQRKAVVRMLPQTAKLYASVGLPVNLRGFDFRDVRSSIVKDGDQSILVVEGEIRGLSRDSTELPRLQLSLRAADGHEIYAWTAEAPRATLQQGEVTPFRARLVAPPSEGQDVVVRFERDARVVKQ